MKDKCVWLLGFMVDVVVFFLAAMGITLAFLLTETLKACFLCIKYILMLEPDTGLDLLGQWFRNIGPFIRDSAKVLGERLAKSYKEPVLMKKEE